MPRNVPINNTYCYYYYFSRLLVKLDNPLQSAVIFVADTPLPTSCFPSTQLSIEKESKYVSKYAT